MVTNFLILPSDDRRVVREAWLSGDEDALVSVLGGLKDCPPSRQAESDVVEVLRTTASRRVRNAAALTLADLGASGMTSHIVDVLRDPKIPGEAGTLLFVLHELGAFLPLDVIPWLIAEGSYEARAETLMFVEEGRVEAADDQQKGDAKRMLTALASDNDEETAEAACLALTYFAHRSDGASSS